MDCEIGETQDYRIVAPVEDEDHQLAALDLPCVVGVGGRGEGGQRAVEGADVEWDEAEDVEPQEQHVTSLPAAKVSRRLLQQRV